MKSMRGLALRTSNASCCRLELTVIASNETQSYYDVLSTSNHIKSS